MAEPAPTHTLADATVARGLPNTNSPVRLALVRFLRWYSTRIALGGLVLLAGLAIYAPFLANDMALSWRDAHGWRSPLLLDLFNKWSYPHWYDLVFNLLALLLPVLAVTGVLAYRYLRKPFRALLLALGLFILAFIGCQLPLCRLADGTHAALWRERQIEGSLSDFQEAPQGVRAVFAPVAHRFDGTYAGMNLQPPRTWDPATQQHFWLGTDTVGHDVLAQLLFGARISLTIGMVASGISLIIGTFIGAISGFLGGWIDLVLQRVVEIMMCFPTFMLILCVVAMVGHDIFVIMVVIGLTSWAGTARLVRGEFLSHSVRDYVLAGQSLGLGQWRLMFRHILPNALTPLLITATFGIAGAVLSESGLSFIGMGDPTVPSWGTLLDQGREAVDYGWLIYAPGLAIFGLVTALNVIGNALREAFDPKGAP